MSARWRRSARASRTCSTSARRAWPPTPALQRPASRNASTYRTVSTTASLSSSSNISSDLRSWFCSHFSRMGVFPIPALSFSFRFSNRSNSWIQETNSWITRILCLSYIELYCIVHLQYCTLLYCVLYSVHWYSLLRNNWKLKYNSVYVYSRYIDWIVLYCTLTVQYCTLLYCVLYSVHWYSLLRNNWKLKYNTVYVYSRYTVDCTVDCNAFTSLEYLLCICTNEKFCTKFHSIHDIRW